MAVVANGGVMLKGRVVRIQEREGSTAPIARVLYVGIEHEDTAINAVLAAFPQYEGCPIEAHERLSGTAVAFMELDEGEIRDRLTETQINLLKPPKTS